AAARLSYALGLCDSALAEEVEDIVDKVGLPTRLSDLDPEALFAAMGTDKKWQAGHSRFVLLRGMCQPEIVEDVSKATVIQVLQEMVG
ncbi:MAG: 3-dehydroquinate synthase, partial [Chloroflexota bacterium]